MQIAHENGKRILITIDDITKSDTIVTFASVYQDLLSRGFPVFLIMTGLYENVYALKRDKRCSFLLRSEQLTLKPLNRIGMANQYQQTFACSSKEAQQMAVFTKGYSYAFQVLGYIMWDKGCTLEEAKNQFDERMSEYCYEKIWEDLSESEKRLVSIIAESKDGKQKAKDIIAQMKITPKVYSVFRDRLVKKGIVDGSEHGFVSLALPRFVEYIKSTEYEEIL